MKKNVNVMMDLELKKALDKDAKKNHRSVGKHINFIINNYLTNNCDDCDGSGKVPSRSQDLQCDWYDCRKCNGKGVA